MSTGETGEHDPTDLFGGLSDDSSEASLDTEENTASPGGGGAAGGFLGQVEAAGVAKPPTATDGKPPSGDAVFSSMSSEASSLLDSSSLSPPNRSVGSCSPVSPVLMACSFRLFCLTVK